MLMKFQNIKLLPIRVALFTLLVASALLFTASAAFAQAASGITVPAGGSSVSGDVIIQGTAVIEPFQKYELAYKREPNGDDAYAYFDGGTSQVVNGSLGIWRTSTLEPGIYSLRLRVVKLDGNYGEFFALNISVNQQAATETPTVTPTVGEATPTPIPSATYTPGPTSTPNIGEVAQPQTVEQSLSPTDTPTAEAVALAPVDNQTSSRRSAMQCRWIGCAMSSGAGCASVPHSRSWDWRLSQGGRSIPGRADDSARMIFCSLHLEI